MIGIAVGLVVSNAVEWFAHRYVLHGLGQRRESFWAFHWHEHHRAARRHGFRDPDYERSVMGDHAQGKEAAVLVAATLATWPLFPVAPFFVGTVTFCAGEYYYKHRKSHLDPGWAREHLPWHYDHHMGPDQNANWCVTRPWFDNLMGTRKPYVGTELEAKHRARRAAAAASGAAAVADSPDEELAAASA